jgi:hypothetical protein
MEDLKRRLYGSIAGEPAPQFCLVDRFLVVPLGDAGEVVKVFEQLLILGDGEDDGRAPALGIHAAAVWAKKRRGGGTRKPKPRWR